MDAETCDVLIVGGGPAGLRGAELVSAAGLRTVLVDQKPSVGRKFLVAGRGGLNLTHSESVEKFPGRYEKEGGETERWRKLLDDFPPGALRIWAEGLGIETFVGTSGRVFPVRKQAAPLLRRWMERLRKQGVSFRTRHSLTGFRRAESGGIELKFATPRGETMLVARAVIFALGGASWPQTGSDGGWTKLFGESGIRVAPLLPANCGYEIEWPALFLAKVEGLPLKNVVVRAQNESVAGELLITHYGIEGGAIYQLGWDLRALTRPEIHLDLKPAFTAERLIEKLGAGTSTENLLGKAARVWRLSPVMLALLEIHGPYKSSAELAARTKSFPLVLRGPRPIAEAISSAGGVEWEEMNDNLMLKQWQGIFCAGEMIDWEAPTGGYLLQGCFSTATRAARGAVEFLRKEGARKDTE